MGKLQRGQGQEKLCWRFVIRLLCWFPNPVSLGSTDVRQKVSALCSLSQNSSGARPQRGASLYNLSCVNAPQVGLRLFYQYRDGWRVFLGSTLRMISSQNFVSDKAFPGMSQLQQVLA